MNTATAKLASVLLQYPTTALFDGFTELTAFAAETGPKPARRNLCRFLDWLGATAPDAVAQHYVQTFDLRRRCALYLTYYRYGDTRKRGMAMLAFKTAYRQADFTPIEDELPDYLPLVLEFAALTSAGTKLLQGRHADLELLRRALHAAETPYVDIVEAVSATLPSLKRRDLALVRNHQHTDPPHEDVGLEPFAPPEYLGAEGNPT